jgi:hypothetical protein
MEANITASVFARKQWHGALAKLSIVVAAVSTAYLSWSYQDAIPSMVGAWALYHISKDPAQGYLSSNGDEAEEPGRLEAKVQVNSMATVACSGLAVLALSLLRWW